MAPAAAALAAVALLTAPPAAPKLDASGPPVSYAQVHNIVTARCVTCHSSNPAISIYGPKPGGVSFEDDARVRELADRIRVRAVETKTMPLGNMTGITEEERAILGRWVAQGAKLE